MLARTCFVRVAPVSRTGNMSSAAKQIDVSDEKAPIREESFRVNISALEVQELSIAFSFYDWARCRTDHGIV